MISANRKGFSLIEVLIALTVLATVLLAFHRLQAVTIRMNQDARFHCLAPLLAKERISRFLREGDRSVGTQTGQWENGFPGWRWQLDVTALVRDAQWPLDLEGFRIEAAVYPPQGSHPFRLHAYRWLPEP